MTSLLRPLIFSAAALILRCCVADALEVPPLSGRINDLAGLLSQEQANSLEDQLGQFEQETGHQLALLTIATLNGESLEDFSIRVADAWKIGHKGNDNGVILLVVRDDRKLRIEVGYGLEGVLPDAIANRIINGAIVPRFRDNDFGGGIQDGLIAVQQTIRGETLPENQRNSISRKNDDGFWGSLVVFLLLYFPGVVMRRLYAPPSRSRGVVVGAAVGIGAGGLAGVISNVAGLNVGPAAFLLLFLLATLLGILEGLLGARRTALYFGRRRNVGWSDPFYVDDDGYSISRERDRFRGGGYPGAGSGSGSTGSSSSGGGFSGGGGGFGGGGASGGW